MSSENKKRSRELFDSFNMQLTSHESGGLRKYILMFLMRGSVHVLRDENEQFIDIL